MYVYCENNPVLNYDPDGEAALISFIFGVCAGISAVTTFATIVEQDKENGNSTNYVDAIARSIVNAGAFISCGIIANEVSSSNTTSIMENKINKISKNSNKESTSFVPKEYWTRDAPKIATPNTKIEHFKLNIYTNKIEKSTVIYDFTGRQRYRIDFSNHGRLDHSSPHLHEIIWNSKYSPTDGKEMRWDFK